MPAEPVRQRIVVPFAGHAIGEGFNSENVERVGTALSVPEVGEDPQAPGQSADFRFQLCTSQSSLEQALNIGASIDARYALFSGGGKFDFAESSAVNSTSTYIVASGVVTNALRFGKSFEPNERAQALIRAGDEDAFKRAFGDRFTQALHTGGEFYALVRVTSSSTVHQQKISASLHAELNGLLFGGSFKASLDEAQKDSSAHTEIDIQIHQTGGVGAQIQVPGTDADRIREHMNQFADAAHANAAAFQAELLTYDTLALPFPPPEEIAERRQVLEDCLAQRQRYWTAISDLTFAQTENAPLIFKDLPSPENLTALESAFRRILNDLMTHARQVSSGVIPPTVFVATGQPPLPHFKRRTSGSFATWWARAKNDDPTLLRDERLLIADIGRSCRHLLSVPIEQAPPETVEQAADLITELGINTGSDHLEFPRHQSLASLPKMLDAPLRSVFMNGTQCEGLTGLEEFSRLENITAFDGRLSDLTALAALTGLESLQLGINSISDLAPLAGLTSLRSLDLQRNAVEDLRALTSVTTLEVLYLPSNRISSLQPLGSLQALRSLALNAIHNADMFDNPIVDSRALVELPRLTNPLLSQDQFRLGVFTTEGAPSRAAVASRIRRSPRFQLTSDSGAAAEVIEVQGLFEWDQLAFFDSPVVVAALRFESGEVGIAVTRPEDRTQFMRAAELVDVFADRDAFNGDFDGTTLQSTIDDRASPHFFVEVGSI